MRAEVCSYCYCLAPHGSFCCRFRQAQIHTQYCQKASWPLSFSSDGMFYQLLCLFFFFFGGFFFFAFTANAYKRERQLQSNKPFEEIHQKTESSSRAKYDTRHGWEHRAEFGDWSMCVCVSTCEWRCGKGLPPLSQRRLYFWIYASAWVQNSVCGDCVGLERVCVEVWQKELVVGKFWKEKKLDVPMPSSSLESTFRMPLFNWFFYSLSLSMRLYTEGGDVLYLCTLWTWNKYCTVRFGRFANEVGKISRTDRNNIQTLYTELHTQAQKAHKRALLYIMHFM